MNPWTLFALAAAPAAPAQADLTATFVPPGGTTTIAKVEVSQDGNARMDFGKISFFKRGARMYLVIARGSRPIVIDMAALQTELRASNAKSRKDVCGPFEVTAAKADLVHQGNVTIHGRTGDAWFKRGADGLELARPDMVVSHDPALAPLGAFLAEQYRVSNGLLPDCPALNAVVGRVEAALSGGTAILLNGMELADVREGAVDPKRFELPAPPMSVGAMRSKGSRFTVLPKPD